MLQSKTPQANIFSVSSLSLPPSLSSHSKNVVYNYSDAEAKVREATSNDPWGPSSAVMTELADYTFHVWV